MNNILIAALTFTAGILIGWLITKLLLGQRLALLQASLNMYEPQLQSLKTENEKLSEEIKFSGSQLSAASNEKTRYQSILEEQMKRHAEIQEELTKSHKEYEAITGELQISRELQTTVKTKYDKLFTDNIETSNEKNRVKDQVEQYRLKENELNQTIATLSAKYDEALKSIKEQKEFVEASQKSLKDSFDALSSAALNRNNEAFLDLAKTALESHVTEAKGDLEKRQQAIDSMVKPLGESLNKMDEKINSLESKREGAYGNISTLLDQVKLSTVALDKETRSLVMALKTSHTRGRYGEIALRRLVEFAGMVDQCDFVEQESANTDSGRLRPDMIIKLPANRQAVVDSKVPLNAYLRIFETDDAEMQKIYLGQHVSAIKTHIKQLSGKAYWDQFKEAPDFVVLFMQIESSFGAALSAWPELIEEALNNRIIVATPTTLITILRSIGYSWNQLKTIENIEEIRDAAVELYERSATLIDHISGIGKGLQSSINNYNKAVGSLENSFMPQGRRIQQLSQAYVKKQLITLAPLEVSSRPVTVLPPIIPATIEEIKKITPDAVE